MVQPATSAALNGARLPACGQGRHGTGGESRVCVRVVEPWKQWYEYQYFRLWLDGSNIKGDNTSAPDARVKVPPKARPRLTEREDAKKWTNKRVGASLGVAESTVRLWLDGSNRRTANTSAPDARVKVMPKARPRLLLMWVRIADPRRRVRPRVRRV